MKTTKMPDYRQWQSAGHDDMEPRDQQRDLFGAYWAEVGPGAYYGPGQWDPGGWSYTIMDFDEDNAIVASGNTASEQEAKAAVDLWVYWNRPGFRYDVQRTVRWLLSFVPGRRP